MAFKVNTTETKPAAVFSQSFSKDPKGKYGLAKNGILGHAEAGRSTYVALTPEESNEANQTNCAHPCCFIGTNRRTHGGHALPSHPTTQVVKNFGSGGS